MKICLRLIAASRKSETQQEKTENSPHDRQALGIMIHSSSTADSPRTHDRPGRRVAETSHAPKGETSAPKHRVGFLQLPKKARNAGPAAQSGRPPLSVGKQGLDASVRSDIPLQRKQRNPTQQKRLSKGLYTSSPLNSCSLARNQNDQRTRRLFGSKSSMHLGIYVGKNVFNAFHVDS